MATNVHFLMEIDLQNCLLILFSFADMGADFLEKNWAKKRTEKKTEGKKQTIQTHI